MFSPVRVLSTPLPSLSLCLWQRCMWTSTCFMAGFFQFLVAIDELFSSGGGDQSGDVSSGAWNRVVQDLLVRKTAATGF
ncbi:hypothetical protein D8674_014414 [Pyrus ussuriensis x Pyrus communis]|uniref:Uncharacterized protein n=1 Tax=Pyrus ussuriensis x Pyrus communis TaxID=2448454 RepID=A0A5N5GSI3_9ROSA|nr:hypothetical protein D8674_014414 [Pyrus ussuriensis x Pyrus communis]